MGREWHWSTRSLGRGECKESSPGCMGGMFQNLQFHHLLFTGSSSCCRAPLSSSSPSLPPRIDRTSQQHNGLEAPRNSLELDEGKASWSTTSAIEEEFKDVPVGIEIVPTPASLSNSNKKKAMYMEEEEKRSSLRAETPRTPSVVARLMGLEIPVEQSPSPTPKTPPLMEQQAQFRMRSKKKKNAAGDQCGRESPSPRQHLRSLDCNISASHLGSRSLPETPRVSSSRSYDVDPRRSLQLNKENTHKAMHEFSYLCEVTGDYSLPPSPSAYAATKSRKKDFGRHHDENKSPWSQYHAREFVKQVKESIHSRREGGGASGGGSGGGGDEVKSKSRRTRPTEKKLAMADSPSSTCSPQISFLEAGSNKAEDDTKKPSRQLPPKARLPSQLTLSKALGGTRDHSEAKAVKVVLNKCKKDDHERFTGRIRKQTHSPLNTRPPDSRSPPTLVSLFQSADLLPERNLADNNNSSSLPSTLTPRVKEAPQAVSRSPFPFGGGLQKNRQGRALKNRDPEFRYIRSIFERAGIAGIHTLRWYSPSLPIDPIIFHRLELEFAEGERCRGTEEEDESRRGLRLGRLRYRWNRKLLFHLVQEILGDLLGCSNLSSSSPSPSTTTTTIATTRLLGLENFHMSNGEELLLQLLAQIEHFPGDGVGDIDALVAGDLPEANVRRLLLHPSVVEEAGSWVFEVEQEILDGLVGETAASLALSSSSSSFSSPSSQG